MREVIYIQVGKAGCQIGESFIHYTFYDNKLKLLSGNSCCTFPLLPN
jgi:hypothetical protein